MRARQVEGGEVAVSPGEKGRHEYHDSKRVLRNGGDRRERHDGLTVRVWSWWRAVGVYSYRAQSPYASSAIGERIADADAFGCEED